MRWQGIAYRAHDPRWSWAPLSGEGAKLHGGRFNPPGQPALYLALSIEGMFLEMGHGFGHRLDPLTVVSYAVDMDAILDLRTDDTRRAAKIALQDMACAWAFEHAEGREPSSWTLSRHVLAQGMRGILVPSFANGAREDMSNLVLWQWAQGIAVIDPQGRLPKGPAV